MKVKAQRPKHLKSTIPFRFSRFYVKDLVIFNIYSSQNYSAADRYFQLKKKKKP